MTLNDVTVTLNIVIKVRQQSKLNKMSHVDRVRIKNNGKLKKGKTLLFKVKSFSVGNVFHF